MAFHPFISLNFISRKNFIYTECSLSHVNATLGAIDGAFEMPLLQEYVLLCYKKIIIEH